MIRSRDNQEAYMIKYFLLLAFFCIPTFAQTLNDSFESSGNITDGQAKEAQTFVHQGIRDEAISEGCEAQGLGTCSQNDVIAQGSILNGTLGQMLEQNMGKLYTVIFGAGGFMSGQGPQVSVVSKENQNRYNQAGNQYQDANGNQVSKKDQADSKTDYCIYAAMGYEVISGFIQTSLQDKITQDLKEEKDIQLKALLALKKTHEARRKTSLYQGTIYAATSACYIARAASSKGRVVMDFQYWAKMTAAGALSALYYTKARKHKLASEAVQTVINGLPSTGDCNPWTKTTCFCSEKTSKTLYPDTFQQVCVLNSGNPEPAMVSVGCGVMSNGQMSYDKECKCKQSNSCFKTKLTSANMKFTLGNNLMGQANRGFELLGNGQFDSGQFDNYGIQSGAYAAKIKKNIAVSGMPKIKVDPKNQGIANEFAKIMPASAAGLVANSASMNAPGASGDGGAKAALDKLPTNLKDKIEATEPVKYTSKGSGFESVDEGKDQQLTIPGGDEKGSDDSTEVLTFAEKAINNADVTNSPDTPIFDIISNRYMRSGINKLKVEESK